MPRELYRILSVRISSKRIWLFRSEERDQYEIQTHGDGGSNEINRRREVRMYIVLYISVSSAEGPSMHVSTATVSTVVATGTLRQGRLMADHGGLYSNAKLQQIGAKEGQGGKRARYFSYCKREKRRGTVVGWYAR
jgi:hypothetical protein